MAILGIKVPHDVARLFSQIEAPGAREPLGHQHITLLHLGDDVPIEQLAKAIVAVYGVTSKTKPFTAQTNRVTTFPPHPDHGTLPVICPISSPDLHALQGRLKVALDRVKVDYSKKFPEFKPHVTLSYLEDPLADADGLVDKEIHPIAWAVADIVMWGGDDSDQRFSANFPLSMGKTAGRGGTDVLYRALVRVARWGRKHSHDENGYCAPTCPCHGEVYPEEQAPREPPNV